MGTLNVQRGLSQISNFKELLEKGSVEQALDVCIVRGGCTRTAIATVATLARAKTSCLVLWSRKMTKAQEPSVAEVRELPLPSTGDEDGSDVAVMQKASEIFGAAKPKCALIHFVGDKIKQTRHMDKPFHHIDEHIAAA